MASKKSQLSSKAIKQDNIAGAGGGMLIASLANNLPEGNQLKSWLLILAPLLTIIIKSSWDFIWAEIVTYFKKLRASRLRNKAVKNIEKLLKNPSISNEKKTELSEKREQIKLSSVEDLLAHVKKLTGS